MRTILWLVVAVVMTIDKAPEFAGVARAQAPGYSRPTTMPQQSRSAAVATRGMAATSHPAAVQAALEVLQQGGSAADAAIAANAVLTVVEPMSCGIGGDLFVLYWDNETRTLHGLNGSGRSPASLTRDELQRRGLEQIPIDGPLSWSTPGCVDGWRVLHEKFGRRPWKELLAAAIREAEEGFPVTEVIASYWKSGEKGLSRWPDSAATFLVDGRAPHFGEVFRNPRMAATLRTLADEGPAAFYRGPLAEQLAAFSQAQGGFLTAADLAAHTSQWVEPISTTYRGVEVFQLPPNGQGLAALQMLNLLEPYDLAALGPGSAEYLHLFIEAKKLSFVDRARWYADPDFDPLPIAALASKAYAAERGKLIDRQRALADIPQGDPRLAHGDTVYLTVVDAQRNCCSLIQSVYYGFGSQMTVGELGFCLQNRGSLFSLDDDHPNRYEPRKRPFHTIIPALAMKEGRPWFCFGVMGGDTQPQGHVQVLVNMLDFGLDVQQAGDAARVRHIGSPTPTGVAADGVGTVLVEPGISDEAIEQLRAKGHRVVRGRDGFGGYQGIVIDWERGVLHGGAEPRKDGVALGY